MPFNCGAWQGNAFATAPDFAENAGGVREKRKYSEDDDDDSNWKRTRTGFDDAEAVMDANDPLHDLLNSLTHSQSHEASVLGGMALETQNDSGDANMEIDDLEQDPSTEESNVGGFEHYNKPLLPGSTLQGGLPDDPEERFLSALAYVEGLTGWKFQNPSTLRAAFFSKGTETKKNKRYLKADGNSRLALLGHHAFNIAWWDGWFLSNSSTGMLQPHTVLDMHLNICPQEKAPKSSNR